MSIRSVQKQIRTALDDNKLTTAEAQKIVETAEKGPITTGEAKQISNLYEDGQWVFPKNFPHGALPQPKPPEYELESGAAQTLAKFFVENRVPQGETYTAVKKDIEATLANTNFYDSPMSAEPKGLKHLHNVFIRDQRPVDGNKVDAYVNTQKDEFYIHTTSARMMPGAPQGPEWFGPFALTEAAPVEPLIQPVPRRVMVANANDALKTIHSRLTADIRVEDDISNFSLRVDGSVGVVVGPHARNNDADILDAAMTLLDAAGMKGADLDIVRPAIQPLPPHVMVANANDALKAIHGRMTEELRGEDDISNFSLRTDGSVAVVVGPHARGSDEGLLALAKEMLDEAGLKGVALEIIRPAIQPVPRDVMVNSANDALKTIHGRLTADIRVEDDISNFSLRDNGSVAVVVGPHARGTDADVLAAAKALLDDAGLRGAALDIVRPAVDPFGMFGAEQTSDA